MILATRAYAHVSVTHKPIYTFMLQKRGSSDLEHIGMSLSPSQQKEKEQEMYIQIENRGAVASG